MTPDLQRKLFQIYGPDGNLRPTPVRTQTFIEQQRMDQEELNLIREKTGIGSPDVLQVILGVRRGLKEHQVSPFYGSVMNIKTTYDGSGDAMLLKLTPDCIGKKGKINQKKLRRNLEKGLENS